MELILKTACKNDGTKVYALFLWNEKNRNFSKIKECEKAEQLSGNLFIMREYKKYPMLYTIVNNRLESKVIPTDNISYRDGVILYEKGKGWYGLQGAQEIFLGEVKEFEISSLLKAKVLVFFNKQNREISFLRNGEVKRIYNPFDEYFFTSFYEKIFIKNKDGFYDCYDMRYRKLLTDKDFPTANNITYTNDVDKHLYLWSKQKQSWKQFGPEFRIFFNSALVVDTDASSVILYKIEDDLEITLIEEGKMEITINGVRVNNTLFPFTDYYTYLDLDNPKKVSPSLFTRLKKHFLKK